MFFILYNRSSLRSGRKLKDILKEHSSCSIRGGYPQFLAKTLNNPNITLSAIINLGVPCTISLQEDYPITIINKAEIIKKASNKKTSCIIFQEKNVPSPYLYCSIKQVKTNDYPVIARNSYHKKGNGFWFCRNYKELRKAFSEGASYAIDFIPNTREYRIHCFVKDLNIPIEDRSKEDYISIKISEKIQENSANKNQLDTQPQKNHAFGWVFKVPSKEKAQEEIAMVRNAAKQAIAALGLDFGAVDVMYSLYQKKSYVLEVNTAPSLADPKSDTLNRYSKHFIGLLGE